MSHIELTDVTLHYPIYNFQARSLRNVVVAASTGGRVKSDARNYAVVEALRNITLSIEEGSRVALIGRNGAGKSTLLRVMAGLYHPTAGTVRSDGRISTLFDLGLGMDPEATGYENIYLAGYARGMSRVEIEEIVEDVCAMSGLGEYVYLPTRIYSSGMSARLAFAISTAVIPEILLIDEVFGAGDATFVQVAQERMERMLSSSRIVVFASHATSLVQQICNKGVLLDRGEVMYYGPIDDALAAYGKLIASA
jgi:ABC-2 type transport system ATP-binding protein/lipopolysaccharide transport system ATP-binding protein